MIKIYGKPNCPNCETAKNMLESKGIFYKYFDVSVNEEALSFVKSIGAKSVPVVFDEDELIGNFIQFKHYFSNL